MNDGCRPSLAVATTDNIALVASGASMESSSTYVGRNETASFRKQGYSLSASGSTEEEWFSAETDKVRKMRETARSMVMQENEFLKLCPGRYFDTVVESKVAKKKGHLARNKCAIKEC